MKLSEIGDEQPKKLKLSDVSSLSVAPEEPSKPVIGFERKYFTPQGKREMSAAFGRGIVESPGAIGDIEKMAFPKETTIAPTSEGIRKTLGLKETPKDYKGAKVAGSLLGGGLLGEVFPAGASAVKGAYGVGRAAVSPEASLTAKLAEPVGESTIGKDILQKVWDKVSSVRQGRSEEARALFENMYRDAKPVENYIREGYIQDLKNYLIENQGKLSKEKESVLLDAIKRIRPDAKIEALDEERRILRESVDPYATGADAIKNDAYKIAHDLLLKNISNRVKSAPETYARYAELSRDLNEFGALLGKKLTTPAGEYLPEIPKIAAEDVPKTVFKNEETVAALKKFSGDPEFVNDAARKYIANELSGKSSAEEVNKFIRNNGWLKQVPEVERELKSLAGELSLGKKARYGAYGLGAILAGSELSGLGKKVYNIFGD